MFFTFTPTVIVCVTLAIGLLLQVVALRATDRVQRLGLNALLFVVAFLFGNWVGTRLIGDSAATFGLALSVMLGSLFFWRAGGPLIIKFADRVPRLPAADPAPAKPVEPAPAAPAARVEPATAPVPPKPADTALVIAAAPSGPAATEQSTAERRAEECTVPADPVAQLREVAGRMTAAASSAPVVPAKIDDDPEPAPKAEPVKRAAEPSKPVEAVQPPTDEAALASLSM